jgi:OmpA-OmpF porin, OOP family
VRLLHLILIFSLPAFLLRAQNLVPNFSFEKYAVCPGTFTQSPAEFTVPGWQPAGLGAPDHFHYCSRGEASVPYNWAGVSEAYEGDGYVGLYLWMNDDRDYREYLRCRLPEPLVKDSTYYLEFHYKLSSYSAYCIDRIGLLLSENDLTQKHDRHIMAASALNVIRDSALTKTTGIWEAARFEYKAKGNESYLLIGNFFSNAETKNYRLVSRPMPEPMLATASYYYIDGVILVPKFKIREQLAANVGDEFRAEKASFNTPYILKHIQFEFNSARLDPASFTELDNLSAFLLKNPQVKVEVSGHTDDVGEDTYNLELSGKRSESVAAYLISKGVEKQRITTQGYGKAQPLIQSTSEDARKLNRRVEVRFIR